MLASETLESCKSFEVLKTWPTDSWKRVINAMEQKKKRNCFFLNELSNLKEKCMPLKLFGFRETICLVYF